jgi:hypothetical protein
VEGFVYNDKGQRGRRGKALFMSEKQIENIFFIQKLLTVIPCEKIISSLKNRLLRVYNTFRRCLKNN